MLVDAASPLFRDDDHCGRHLTWSHTITNKNYAHAHRWPEAEYATNNVCQATNVTFNAWR